MPITKEIWAEAIVENLFAENSFLSKCYRADDHVNQGKVVHIPNAGAPSGVQKNRTVLPAAIATRTDVDLTFTLDEYTTNPVRIAHAETVELSYSKRESIIKNDRAALDEQVARDTLFNWAPNLRTNNKSVVLRTTGANVVAHAPAATGNRKSFTRADVKAAMIALNKQNIPKQGRYAIIDSEMYGQLLDSMTEQQAEAFHSQANLATGTIGKLYGFDIYERAETVVYETTGVLPKVWGTGGAATDCAAALFWHEGSVCAALGEHVAFEDEKSATNYGDVLSFLVRAGGRAMRADGKGVVAVVQAQGTGSSAGSGTGI